MVVNVPLLTPACRRGGSGWSRRCRRGWPSPLVDSLVNEVVVSDDAIRAIVPREPLPMREAFRLALRRIQDVDVTTTWAGADLPESVTGHPRTELHAEEPAPSDPAWSGGTVLSDDQELDTTATPEALFATLEGLGGRPRLVLAAAAVARPRLARRAGGRHRDATRTASPRPTWPSVSPSTSGGWRCSNVRRGCACTPR